MQTIKHPLECLPAANLLPVPTGGRSKGFFSPVVEIPPELTPGTLPYYRKLAEKNKDIAALVQMIDRLKSQLKTHLEFRIKS